MPSSIMRQRPIRLATEYPTTPPTHDWRLELIYECLLCVCPLECVGALSYGIVKWVGTLPLRRPFYLAVTIDQCRDEVFEDFDAFS